MMIRSVSSFASRIAQASAALRRRRAASVVGAVVALTTLGWSSPASAQGWLADRRYAEGEGIRTGDLELHPGIGGEVGYDTNWFLRSNATGPNIVNGAPNLPPRGALVLRLTPSFYVSTLGQQRSDLPGVQMVTPRVVSFRGGVSATGRYLIGDEMADQKNVSVNADARVDINQNRPLGFGVFAGYQRIIQPQVLADPNLAFNRDDLRGGVEVIAIPGGGTLDIRGGYQLYASLFEESNGAPYTSITHEFTVKDRWRFRPRTALFSDTSLRIVNYPNAARAANYLNDAMPLRTRVGLTGLITDSFGALAAVGYGGTFFSNPNAASSVQYDSINAQLEGTYYLGRGAANNEPGKATLLLSTVALGVMRDFQISLLGNYYAANKLYARLEYWYGGKVVIRLDGFGELDQYPPIFLNAAPGVAPVQVTSDFVNTRLGGSLFAEYRLTSAFGLNVSVDYVNQLSNTQLPSVTLPGQLQAGVYDLNYDRLQAFLGARYFF